MSVEPYANANKPPGVIFALGEQPIFRPGDAVRILTRSPIGHYRVPTYLRGKVGTVDAVIEPAAIDNEQEGFGRNASAKRHYYRAAIPMPEIMPIRPSPLPRSLPGARSPCPSRKRWPISRQKLLARSSL